MNERFERIFELAKQADLIQWDSLPSGARTPDHESVAKARKFAELIVKEMLRLLEQYSRDSFPEDIIDDFDKGYLGGLYTAQEAVKKHFGVEE